ncbi:hypothetical protein [Niabella sp.]|uniref:hypothetical protein n=1 Tax=Niabella sp. TaxID=1962976 RepID=UPI00261D4530|nr:hypothetical protein [Niabella sp.]
MSRCLFSLVALICSLYTYSQCGTSITTGEFNGTFGTTTVPRDLQTPPGGGYSFGSGNQGGQPAGRYAVISKSYYPNWHSTYMGIWSYAGHTTGSDDDAYLAVNGSTSIGSFYKETVSLSAGATYTFGIWHAAAFNGSLYGLEIRVYEGTPTPTSTPIARAQTGTVSLAAWTPLFLNFTTGAAGDYTIQLLNSSTASGGNDFSVDDITLVANATCKPVAYPIIKDVKSGPTTVNLGDKPLRGNETGDTQHDWIGGSATISSLPTNGFVLTYDGHVITQADIDGGGYVIANYDAAKLSIAPGPGTPGNATSTSFSYAVNGKNARSDDTTYTVNFAVPLPVTFGTFTASLSNGNLVINWTTGSEVNNDHFEIEASADGTHFTTIGTVKSLAPDGNSTDAIQYRFSVDMSSNLTALGLGVLILGGLGICFRRRSRMPFACLMVLGLAATIGGCRKAGEKVADDSKLYIRVAQVNKDNTRSYSKVIMAVRE